MFTIKDFKVTLKNKNEVKDFIRKHGEFASVCYNSDIKNAEKIGESCLQSGHLSGSRHLYMVFELKNVPRSAVDQLVRHTQGFVTNVQSLRYCNKDGKVDLYAAPEIAQDEILKQQLSIIENASQAVYHYMIMHLDVDGYQGELANQIARTVLPIGIATECNVAVNLECLMHLSNVRLCTRAELPIRTIVRKMVNQVLEVEPRYRLYLKPNCEKLGHCPEGKYSCGYYDSITRFAQG